MLEVRSYWLELESFDSVVRDESVMCGRCRLMLLPGIASIVQGGVLETCPSFPSITVKQIHSQIHVVWIWLKIATRANKPDNIFRVISYKNKKKTFISGNPS